MKNIINDKTTVYSFTKKNIGTSYSVRFFIIQKGQLVEVSYTIAQALACKQSALDGGVMVRGAGMDMAYHLLTRYSKTTNKDGSIYHFRALKQM